MNYQKYENLKSKYGDYSSWALWDDTVSTFTSKRLEPDYQKIEQNVSSLHTSVVLIGLNISKPLEKLWANFHCGKNDAKLMYAFNDSLFKGAYMTDIIKDEIDVSSSNIESKLKSGEIELEKHILRFLTEMDDVGANEKSLFLLFGNLAYSIFAEKLGSQYPNHLKCKHYSARGTQYDYVKNLWESILSHSKKVSFTRNNESFVVNQKMSSTLVMLEQKMKNKR